MKSLLAGILYLVLMNSAFSAIIDNGGFTTDTDTNLQWADLTATNALSYNQASSVFDVYDGGGWRYATNSEVESLFATLFDGYYENTSGLLSDSVAGATYADQTTDINYFQSLFGLTADTIGYTQSFGLYQDEDDITRLMGVYKSLTTDQDIAVGTEFTAEYNPDLIIPNFGAFIVRGGVSVTEASSLYLLALGLLGLFGVARRKV